jgi:integrase
VAKRGNGEGTIYKRSDGRWAGGYCYRDDRGRQRRRYVYGRTRQAAAQKLRAAQQRVAEGLAPPPDRLTVTQFFDRWAAEIGPSVVKPSTLDGYRWVFNRYWRDSIGHRRLVQLRPEEVIVPRGVV